MQSARMLGSEGCERSPQRAVSVVDGEEGPQSDKKDGGDHRAYCQAFVMVSQAEDAVTDLDGSGSE